ncbi:hypothetical protein EAG_03618 [Camponotus floridanus]|uniref:Uncharacterized protein n=1 Tax=Camponotus floridanus TaxID=104421 RepID=E2AP16_CAMFO|nr:hypothetical protein EAG_03618 [Camponotus floridanus]
MESHGVLIRIENMNRSFRSSIFMDATAFEVEFSLQQIDAGRKEQSTKFIQTVLHMLATDQMLNIARNQLTLHNQLLVLQHDQSNGLLLTFPNAFYLYKDRERRFTDLLPKGLFYGTASTVAEFNCIGRGGGKPKERSKLTKCAPIFFNAEVHFQVDHVLARDRLSHAISSISLTVETQRIVLHNSERKYFYPDNIAVKCSLLVDRINGRESGKKRVERKKKTEKPRGKKDTAANKGQRSSASSRQRYLSTTQKGEYQAVKGIYMDSAKVPPTSVSEKLGVRYLESIGGRRDGRRDGGDKSARCEVTVGRWSGANTNGVITFVTENFQYHRPRLLTDRKLVEWTSLLGVVAS